MALSNDQKKEILGSLIGSVDTDVFRQEMQLAAFQAELDVADDATKDGAQANVDNAQRNLASLQARAGAWQKQLDALSK